MSRSPLEETDDVEETGAYRDHFRVFAQMLSSGLSLSGRERNCCFLNVDDKTFADISGIAGFDFPQDGRAVGLTDWDFDGDMDVWLLNRNRPRIRLLRNEVGTKQQFLMLKLTGTTCNRDAIGARVEVVLKDAKDRKLVKTLYAGHGFATQSTKWLHFGLGERNAIDRVIVNWPGGDSQEFRNVVANKAYKIEQGGDQAMEFAAPGRNAAPLAIRQTEETPAKSDRLRIGLAGTIPTPALTYRTWEGASQKLEFPRKRPLLINLWAQWCAPCLQELKAFSAAKNELADDQTGVDILALTVDGVNDVEAQAVDKAKDYLSRIEFPFESGLATLELGEKLRMLQTPFLEPNEQAALPTSFLISPQGDLTAIYQGPVEVSQLLGDVKRIRDAKDQAANLAIQFPGKWRTFPTQQDHLITLAAMFFTSDRPKDALTFARQALAGDPNSELAQRNIEVASARNNEIRGKIQQFQQQLQANPQNADALFNLGVAYRSISDWDAALVQFEKAVAADADLADAHVELGALYARRGELQKAKSCFQSALLAAPNNRRAQQGLAQIAATRDARR